MFTTLTFEVVRLLDTRSISNQINYPGVKVEMTLATPETLRHSITTQSWLQTRNNQDNYNIGNSQPTVSTG